MPFLQTSATATTKMFFVHNTIHSCPVIAFYPFTELFCKLTGECCCKFCPDRHLWFFFLINHYQTGSQFCVLPESKETLDNKAKVHPASLCCFSEVWKKCYKNQGEWGRCSGENVASLFWCNSHLFIRVFRILKFGWMLFEVCILSAQCELWENSAFYDCFIHLYWST